MIFLSGVASVHRSECELLSRFAVDYVLSEYQSMVSQAASDITTKIFKQNKPFHANRDVVYLPYVSTRTPYSVRYWAYRGTYG